MKPCVGIDLGTSNTAVATLDADGVPATVAIPQVTAPGEVAARPLLPSVVLLPSPDEVTPAALALPWGTPRHAIGEFALARGAELPHAVVMSAKSWLCHPGIDRTGAVLPWHAPGDEAPPQRISPVNAEARILRHLADAWAAAAESGRVPDVPLSECDVVITVPASFDAVARELTLMAAREAALEDVILLEEPQAALYAYLATTPAWREHLRLGDCVLVCDIGGGTTDFALVTVGETNGALSLERVAVGEHILLGGDNMDHALAHRVAQIWADQGKTLDARGFRSLVLSARAAKEAILGGAERAAVTVLARGSRLIGGALRDDLLATDVLPFVLDGFFPVCDAAATPMARPRQALREMGLPYAYDPAVTKHLAQLIARAGAMPTHVLFNGGVLKSAAIRARILNVLAAWRGAPVRELGNANYDGAVALGAAHFAAVRSGAGIRIRGGLSRSYYIGVESATPAIPGYVAPLRAMCVASAGTEEGTHVPLPSAELGLVVGERTTFRFFSSADADTPGRIVSASGLVETAPVEQTIAADGALSTGDVVPVTLAAHITDIGTLELVCQGPSRAWTLNYAVRETA